MGEGLIEGAAGAANPSSLWINAGSQVLSAMLGGSSAPPAVSSAALDGSRWTVSTGGGSASASDSIPWIVWAGIGLALVLYMKKKG